MAYAGDSAERTAFECLGVLHARGYQKLRLSAGMSPSGFNFRYIIAPASSFHSDGMTIRSEHYNHDEALLTSSDGQIPPFDWPEAVDMDPQALADLFLMRCPELAVEGLGADPAYATWYEAMLKITRPTGLVSFFKDYYEPYDGIEVMNLNRKVTVPPPPAPERLHGSSASPSLLFNGASQVMVDISKLESTQVGIAGEYYVAAELSVRGYVASITLRNSRGIDILASNADVTRTVSIQVKTSKGGQPRWMLGKKSESFASRDHFYAFVILSPIGQRPEFYIVPSEVVASTVSTDHATWLKGTKKDGSAHKDSNMRIFRDDVGQFKEAWNLLGL